MPSASGSMYPRVVSSPGRNFCSFVLGFKFGREYIVDIVASRWRSTDGVDSVVWWKLQPPSERRYATRMFSPGL